MSSILWRRLDRPGHEFARLDGTTLEGSALFVHAGEPVRLDYVIVCNERWETQRAKVAGLIGDRVVDVDVILDPAEGWADIDLNFSPSTNTLPIRRLNLAIGQEARVRAAWLRFPSLRLEPLEQVYRRLGETTYRYESAGGAFVAELEVNGAGFVTNYPDLWVSVAAGS